MAIFPMRKHQTELQKWDPMEEVSHLNERVNQLFDRIINGNFSSMESSWLPALDVVENDKSLTIKVDVPGMDSKQISVSIEDDTLVIKGERENEVKEKTDNCLHMERGYGIFIRRYNLPDSVDRNSIKATCSDGLLTVKLAKVPGKKKEIKEIPVSS